MYSVKQLGQYVVVAMGAFGLWEAGAQADGRNFHCTGMDSSDCAIVVSFRPEHGSDSMLARVVVGRSCDAASPFFEGLASGRWMESSPNECQEPPYGGLVRFVLGEAQKVVLFLPSQAFSHSPPEGDLSAMLDFDSPNENAESVRLRCRAEPESSPFFP